MATRSHAVWIAAAALGLMLSAGPTLAEPSAAVEPNNAAKAVEVAPHVLALSVAVLPFDSKDKALGQEAAEVIAARLSADAELQLVERDHINAILEEYKLSLSAAVQPTQAARIGWLAGAQVLVAGRAYLVDEQVLVTARTIGVETGRVYITQVRGSAKTALLPVLDELAERVHREITARRSQLVAPDVSADKDRLLRGLAETLKDRKLPHVVVAVSELHYGVPATDPAAETELMLWFKECGFDVIDPGNLERGLQEWARDYYQSATGEAVPRVLPEEVKIIVIGQAFSEAGGRFGDLVSAKGRVEVRALDRETGAVIAIARRTTAAIDLSERIAAKQAIEDAASSIAYELIPKLAALRK